MDCSKDMDEPGTLGCQICGVRGRVGGGGLENPQAQAMRESLLQEKIVKIGRTWID
jgi:hypothetical protein